MITTDMLNEVSASHRRYKDDQDLKKREEEQSKKRKVVADELGLAKKRKETISKDISNLEEKAFRLSDEASSTGDTNLFKESHALTCRVRTLKEELKKIDCSILSLQKSSSSQ